MTATRTLLQMRTRARQLADMVGSTFVSDPELTDIVNAHCQDLYDLLIEVRGQPYYATDHSWPTVVGQENYALPTNFHVLSGAPMLYDGSDYFQMRTWEENERARLLNLTSTNIEDVRYRLVAGNLSLLPPPQTTSWTLSIRYVPTFARLVNDADVFDGINGWEQWVELSSAITMMNKQEDDPAALMAERARVEGRIRKLAPARDAANPPRIVDTRRDFGWYDEYYDWDL